MHITTFYEFMTAKRMHELGGKLNWNGTDRIPRVFFGLLYWEDIIHVRIIALIVASVSSIVTLFFLLFDFLFHSLRTLFTGW